MLSQGKFCWMSEVKIGVRLIFHWSVVAFTDSTMWDSNSVPIYYSLVAFLCTGGAPALTISHIYRHLLNYTEPTCQRYIVRIIFMVPVVSPLAIWCSLRSCSQGRFSKNDPVPFNMDCYPLTLTYKKKRLQLLKYYQVVHLILDQNFFLDATRK